MATFRLADPRCYQVAVLGSLLAWGIFVLDFGIRWQNAAAILATAQAVQWFAGRLVGVPRFDPLSALITSLSLTLLLRTDAVAVAALAAAVAIGSKFLVRIRGKHVFNPANIALVTVTFVADNAWVSSGQWGSAALGAFALACLGLLVLTRARRAETTFAFLASFALILFARAAWLGDPLSIPLHQLGNGALLIFAFFMISDPRTTPDAAAARVVYGSLVAGVAAVIQFGFYTPNGPILALAMLAPLVPLLDRVQRGSAYRWDRPAGMPLVHSKGDS
ncbi:MAG: RnfABCDGE type electron transport complex subunit D [Woeseiaceae bacterium]|nr:RnfABCDGE type electron transport complex subunit D [Woeseiaceae bacterium]